MMRGWSWGQTAWEPPEETLGGVTRPHTPVTDTLILQTLNLHLGTFKRRTKGGQVVPRILPETQFLWIRT